MYPVYKGKN